MKNLKLVTENNFQSAGLKQYLLYNGISGVEVQTIDEFNGYDFFDGKIITDLNPDFFQPNLDLINISNSDGLFNPVDYVTAVNDTLSSYENHIIKNTYKVYSVSSTVSGAGRKTFVNALHHYYSLNYKTAKIDFMSRKGFGMSCDLASVMLCSNNSYKKPDVLKLSDFQYVIPGFINISDFIDMTYDDFLGVLKSYNRAYGIEKFIVDVYNPLLPISKKIISNSEKSIVIRKRGKDDRQLYDYISNLTNSETISFVNMVREKLSDNDLPMMKKVNDTYNRDDYKLYLTQIASVL